MVAEAAAGAGDAQVIALPLRERRTLLTEDKDFGQRASAAGRKSLDVALIRLPATARSALGSRMLDLVRKHAGRRTGSFVVLQPERIPISVLP